MLLARVARVFLLEFLRCFSFNFVFKNDFLVVPLQFFFQDEYFLRLFFFKNNKTDISNCIERQSYFRTDLNVSNQKHTKPQFNCKYSNENSNEKKPIRTPSSNCVKGNALRFTGYISASKRGLP